MKRAIDSARESVKITLRNRPGTFPRTGETFPPAPWLLVWARFSQSATTREIYIQEEVMKDALVTYIKNGAALQKLTKGLREGLCSRDLWEAVRDSFNRHDTRNTKTQIDN